MSDNDNDVTRSYDHGPFDAEYARCYDSALKAMALMERTKCGGGPDDDSCDLGHRCSNHEAALTGEDAR
jgi:hypothetical protein